MNRNKLSAGERKANGEGSRGRVMLTPGCISLQPWIQARGSPLLSVWACAQPWSSCSDGHGIMTERCSQGFSRTKKRNMSFSWKDFYSQILSVSNAAEACSLEMGHLAIKCLRLCSTWSVRVSSTQDTGLFILKLVCLGTEIISAKSRLTFPPTEQKHW